MLSWCGKAADCTLAVYRQVVQSVVQTYRGYELSCLSGATGVVFFSAWFGDRLDLNLFAKWQCLARLLEPDQLLFKGVAHAYHVISVTFAQRPGFITVHLLAGQWRPLEGKTQRFAGMFLYDSFAAAVIFVTKYFSQAALCGYQKVLTTLFDGTSSKSHSVEAISEQSTSTTIPSIH